jgi:O-antigen/teichoic acid export membrane protein
LTLADTETGPVAGGRSMRRVLVGGAAYAAVTVLQRALSFLLLPVYARALSPAQYGELGVIIALSQAFIFVMGAGQQFAVFRQWFQLEDDEADRRRYVGTVGQLLLVGPLLVTLLLVPVALTVGADLLQVDGLALVLSIAGTALFVSASVLPFSVLRAQERLRDFVALNLCNAVVTAATTIVAVVVLDGGVRGWVIGFLAGNLATLIASMVVMPWPWQRRPVRRHLRTTLALGLPLVPHQVSLWALQLASRAILLGLVTKAAIGLYTIAFLLTQPIQLLSQALNQAVLPSYGRASKDTSELPALSRLTTHQIVFVAVITAACALVAPPVCRLALPASYAGATDVIPWLCLANGLYSLYAIPMNEVSIFAGRAQYAWVATLTAALLNVAMLYVLVPGHGIVEAGIAATIGSCALVAGIFVYARRAVAGHRVHYEWLRIGRGVAIAAAIYVGGVLSTGEGDFRSLLLRAAWCVPLLLAFFAVGVPSGWRPGGRGTAVG